MKNNQNSNVYKMVILIVQLMSLTVIIATSFLAVKRIKRSVLSLKDLGNVSFFAMFILILLAIAGVTYSMLKLTKGAGKRKEDGLLYLYQVDRLPTEIMLLICTTMFIFFIRLSGLVIRYDYAIYDLMILESIFLIFLDFAFVSSYLSLVRKIKGGYFFSESVTFNMVHVVKTMQYNRFQLMKSLGGYVLLLSVFSIIAWQYMVKRHGWALVVLLLYMVGGGFYWMWRNGRHHILLEGVEKISQGDLEYQLNINDFVGEDRELAIKINQISNGMSKAMEEKLKSERMKTELLTNVSHDIKTPLTSIINYVSLIKLENPSEEKVRNYVDVLEKKSQRLKYLMEDLIEVSKITTGNIILDMSPIDMVELVYQTGGEFEELFQEKGLTLVTRLPKEPVMILADGNKTWRIVQNLYNNVEKYAKKNTQVDVDIECSEGNAIFTIKDTSAQNLSVSVVELSERFVRGDESRTTEGNGLGLSIAKNLVVAMGGVFEISQKKEVFIATVTFPLIKA